MAVKPNYPPLSHACVGTIVYRITSSGEKEYLVQDRVRPGTPYDGKIEFPVGILEDVKQGKRRTAGEQALLEAYEETGLEINKMKLNLKDKMDYKDSAGDEVEGFVPYYQTRQLLGGYPWYMTVFLVEANPNAEIIIETSETKNVRWIRESRLKQMLEKNTDDFFSLQVPAWKFHFQNYG